MERPGTRAESPFGMGYPVPPEPPRMAVVEVGPGPWRIADSCRMQGISACGWNPMAEPSAAERRHQMLTRLHPSRVELVVVNLGEAPAPACGSWLARKGRGLVQRGQGARVSDPAVAVVQEEIAGLLQARGGPWAWVSPSPTVPIGDEQRRLRVLPSTVGIWIDHWAWGGQAGRRHWLEGDADWIRSLDRSWPFADQPPGSSPPCGGLPGRVCREMAGHIRWNREQTGGLSEEGECGGDPPGPWLKGPVPSSSSSGVSGVTSREAPPDGPVGVRPLVGPNHWRRWKIAVSNTWKHKAHINVLELYAETIAMSWILRKGTPCIPRQFVLLQDSQVAVHAGTKGRSSSFPLLRALRRTAGLLLAGNLYADRLWIPSKANPADGPSRKRAVGVF